MLEKMRIVELEDSNMRPSVRFPVFDRLLNWAEALDAAAGGKSFDVDR